MAKKYIPSGYQIINLHAIDDGDGGAILEKTEDYETLVEIFKSRKITKPFLLKLVDDVNSVNVVGFPTCAANVELFLHVGAAEIYISLSGDDLDYTLSE